MPGTPLGGGRGARQTSLVAHPRLPTPNTLAGDGRVDRTQRVDRIEAEGGAINVPLPLPMSVQPFERASLCQALKLSCIGKGRRILVQVSVFIWAFTAWSVLCMEGLGNDCAGGYWGGELEWMRIWGLVTSVFCYVLWAAIAPYIPYCQRANLGSRSFGANSLSNPQKEVKPSLRTPLRWGV